MRDQEELNIDNLIAKYIVGEISPSEEKELMDWCAQSPQNQKTLDDELLIFKRANLPSQQKFDSEKAWQKIQPQIQKPKAGKSVLFPIWRIAAGFALIAAISILIYQQINAPKEFEYLSASNVETQVLPDNTSISLNRDSEVQVAYNERKKTGLIKLSGESLITIPETKKVTWQVQVDQLLIEDIGTVFNVKAYPDSPIVEVSVLEGLVKMYLPNQEGIELSAGEKGIFDKSDNTFSKTISDQNVVAYASRSFSYNNDDLTTVISQLSEVYQKDIRLEGPIGNCRLTVNFDEEELNTILMIISETLNLELQQEGDEFLLSGTGCN